MVGNKSTPKHDRGVKVGNGQPIRTGALLAKAGKWKAGKNVSGINTLYACCDGIIYFTKKKGSRKKVNTYINIQPKQIKQKGNS